MAELGAAAPHRWDRWTRTLGLFALVLLLFGVGSFGAAGATGSLGHAMARGAPVLSGHVAPRLIHPALSTITISSFKASPAAIANGKSTTFFVVASGGAVAVANLTYAYTSLPAGCSSSNASSLPCTSTANGTFHVFVNVSDGHGNTTEANTSLTIGSETTGLFWVANTTVTNLPRAQQDCAVTNSSPFFVVSCYSQSQDPSLLHLSNGNFGLAYEQYTHATTNTCPGAAQATNARVGWTTSSDGGQTFSAPVQIGNRTCSYLNAIEPSFANTGTNVYGAFIEENGSASILPADYGARAGDALGFVSSTNNGGSWSSVKSLVTTGDLARPVLVASGTDLYIVYEDIANNSSSIAGGWLPISVQFLASTNGGLTWSAPTTLPGLNASAMYDALSPSIAVAPNGNVSIAYATNRSCVNPTSRGGCDTYGDNIYTITSSTHGASWGPLQLVAAGIGESTCYSSGCFPSYYESTPQTAIAYDSTGGMYVLYAGTFNLHTFNPITNFRWTALHYAVSGDGGATWTTQSVGAGSLTWTTNYFNPGIGIDGTNVVITYTVDNETLSPAGYLDSSLSQWTANAATGTSGVLANQVLASIATMPYGRLTNFTRSSFPGFGASVAFNATGWALLAYSLAQTPKTSVSSGPGYYYTNTSYATNLSVAHRALATDYSQVVNLTFTETGSPFNQTWSFSIDGQLFVQKNASVTVRNVPAGVTVVFQSVLQPRGWQKGSETGSTTSPQIFRSAATLSYAFTIEYGQVWYPAPGVLPTPGQKITTYYDFFFEYYDQSATGFTDFYLEFYGGPGYMDFYGYEDYVNYSNYLLNYYFYDYGAGTILPASMVFYFPAGFTYGDNYCFSEFGFCENTFELFTENLGTPSFTNGTGTGAFNGGLNCYYSFECSSADWYGYLDNNISVLSPGNQTIYFGGAAGSEYNETVVPVGLPTGTNYSYDWSGTTYQGQAQNTTTVPDLLLGSYAVSDIVAQSTTPGWEYFGHLAGFANHVLVPWTPIVNLTYSALVDLAAPPQTVSISATNLTAGDAWSVSLNGTTYSSSVPWINVTLRPGTYSFGAGDAVSSSGTTGFVPSGVPSAETIAPSTTTITVKYVPSYRLTVNAALGGSFTVNGGAVVTSYTTWAAPGTVFSLAATPAPGFSFLDWAGSGTISYSGTSPTASVTTNSAITESANFESLPGARFNLTFAAAGLPANTQWSVQLNGVGYSSNGLQLTVGNLYAYTAGPQGLYALTVPPAYLNSTSQVRFIVSSAPAQVSTNGTGTPPVQLTFLPESSILVTSTVGGSASATSGASSGPEVWALSGTAVQLAEQASSGYTFAGWTGTGSGSYTGTSPAPSFVSQGAPITELATFSKNPTPKQPVYNITISLATPLEAGTSWSVLLQGVGYSTTGASLTIGNLPGSSTYALVVNVAYSPDGLTRYTGNETNPTSLHVGTSNLPVSIGFSTDYWVSISASADGTSTPSSGWYSAGHSVSIAALPSGTDVFSKWVGTGRGSYSGTNATSTIQVLGPISEVAEFQVPTQQSSTTVASIWQNTGLLAGLAIAGLIVGLGIGLLAFRRRGGSGGTEAASPPETAEESMTTPETASSPEEGA